MSYRVLIVLTVLICVAGFYAWKRTSYTGLDRSLVATHPEWATYFDAAEKYENDTRKNPSDTAAYLNANIQLNTLTSLTKDTRYAKHALELLVQADTELQGKNSIIIMNKADLESQLGDYAAAKTDIERAIALAPGDASYYIRLTELMRYHLASTPDEILAVYAEGQKRVVGAAAIFVSRGAYLRDIGRYPEARADFEAVYKAGVINKEQYTQAIARIDQAEKNK